MLTCRESVYKAGKLLFRLGFPRRSLARRFGPGWFFILDVQEGERLRPVRLRF